MNHSVSPRRSKSLSFHQPTHHEQQPQSIQSLDLPPAISLPNSLGSLYSTLNDHLKLVKVSLKLISNNNRSGSSTNSNRSSRSNSSTTSSTTNSASSPTDQQDQDYNRLLSLLIKNEHNQATTTQEEKNELPSLTTFVHQVTDYIHQLKLDLFSTHQIISTNSAPNSPITPLTAFSSRTDDCLYSILDPNQLVDRLTVHSQKLAELLSQLSFLSQYPTRFPSLPILIPERLLNSAHHHPHHHHSYHQRSQSINQITPDIFKSFPTQQSLRDYFSSESERISSLLPTSISDSLEQTSHQISSALRACKEEAQAVLHDGEVFIREEGEKLKGWVDHETEKLKLALHMGTSRLLTYHELPDEWKNNQFIVKGYRFIPLDRWHHLLLSGIQWHNETINIHTHFLGTLSLFYLLIYLWPDTPHTAPESSTLTDRLISLIFIVCAIKCLICSTAWHLFSGCGTLGPFRRLACVDYVGISGLIAASVMSMEYYGFYCRPKLAALYITFTVSMGIIGMVLPFQPFFDRPESKGIRIIFFVSMAGSALIPQAHMAYLYGLSETLTFYYPALPSVFSYLAGLFFYATNWPERIRPGWVFDTLFHSHQFWHVAIVAAIWLHWRAIGIIHNSGRLGFSCSNQAIENHQISMASSNFPTIALDAWSGLFIPKWLF
ncbi:hypothetical protein MJO28_000626 [Puccinia striiformis f. sp. tritici]|uniref:Uncharacterized protein n=1 Tax=Puccinia striiformis f. sp. tritici TaxID=168172 RepID=A0ACC0EYS4_9BASI|nr:hypothetical protein MJO28_017370 [Puccinia striiformis f. sp. tritici]KAI7962532.1 hypothetical protein MJO28_000626 [Puccinia striiformis f. sp. tritici]